MINKHIIGLKITTTNENNQAQEDLVQPLKKSLIPMLYIPIINEIFSRETMIAI